MTKRKRKKIPKRYFIGKRLEIGRILVEEFTELKSAKAITEEEWIRLVDRLNNL